MVFENGLKLIVRLLALIMSFNVLFLQQRSMRKENVENDDSARG